MRLRLGAQHEDKAMKEIVIHDGKGYWCARRRVDGRLIDLWSPKRKDAAIFHFLEVAQKIAASIPQTVTLEIA